MAASPDFVILFTESLYSGNGGKWVHAVSVLNQTPISPTVTKIAITAAFGTFAWTPKALAFSLTTTQFTSNKASWANEGTPRWGANPCLELSTSTYCKTATCTAINDTCVKNPPNAPCTLHGPCAILAMQGPYLVTVSFSYKTGGTTTTWDQTAVLRYPTSCGFGAGGTCDGLATNVPPP